MVIGEADYHFTEHRITTQDGIDFCLVEGKVFYHSEPFCFDGVANLFEAQYNSEKEVIRIEYQAKQYLRMTIDKNGNRLGYELKPQEVSQ